MVLVWPTAAVIVAAAATTGIADFTLQPVMNRSALKNYAPKVRLDFIRAVTDRAAFIGLASPKLSNSGVEPDTPRFPSRRLTAKEVRPKVWRRLKYSGPWLKYHDARPASEFTFFKRLSGSFHRDSMWSPGCIL